MGACLGEQTKAVYSTGKRCYDYFATMHGYSDRFGNIQLPAEQNLIFFVCYCADILKIRYTTIKLYLCGIRFYFIESHGRDPLCTLYGTPLHQLQYILRSIKRTQIPVPSRRKPITADIVRDICHLLDSRSMYGNFTDCMMAACITLAFFAFLRCGEFTVTSSYDPETNLSAGDIQWLGDQTGFVLNLKRSKTDPFRKGVPILLCALKNSPICPVKHMKKYLKMRNSNGIPGNGPLFVYQYKALTRSIFISLLRRIMTCIGYERGNYSGHSIRAGAATSCADVNIEDHLVKVLGRWNSDCYQRYITTSKNAIALAQDKMSRA